MDYSLGYFSKFCHFLKMAITRKIEVGISSNLLHSISTLICIRKCNKNLGGFFGHFLEKTMDYSLGYFSKFCHFLKMAITRKIEVGISSNLLHSISTLICIRKCNKNLGGFFGHFLEKTMDYSLGYFSKFCHFLKMAITRKIEVGISSNLLHSISKFICIRKCNKNLGGIFGHFLEKTMDYSLGYFSKFCHFLKMAITRKIEVGISSNLLHSISTLICIRKCNKNLGGFFGHFLEKTMDYSLGYFSKFCHFLKMAITRKIEVGISSNLLHSISTLICIRKCNKNLGGFFGHFLEKTMGYSLGYFSKFCHFLKMAITRKIEVGISSNLLHSISTLICIRKCNKNLGGFFGHFLEKTMDYSLGYFSKFCHFLKMAITRKIEVGISSNLLHSISTLICIRKCNKNLGGFFGHFLEKTMDYSLGYFSNFDI